MPSWFLRNGFEEKDADTTQRSYYANTCPLKALKSLYSSIWCREILNWSKCCRTGSTWLSGKRSHGSWAPTAVSERLSDWLQQSEIAVKATGNMPWVNMEHKGKLRCLLKRFLSLNAKNRQNLLLLPFTAQWGNGPWAKRQTDLRYLSQPCKDSTEM